MSNEFQEFITLIQAEAAIDLVKIRLTALIDESKDKIQTKLKGMASPVVSDARKEVSQQGGTGTIQYTKTTTELQAPLELHKRLDQAYGTMQDERALNIILTEIADEGFLACLCSVCLEHLGCGDNRCECFIQGGVR